MRLLLIAALIAAASIAPASPGALSCTIAKTGETVQFDYEGGSERTGHLSVRTAGDDTPRIGIASYGGRGRIARLTVVTTDQSRLEITIPADGAAHAAFGIEGKSRKGTSRADCPGAEGVISSWRTGQRD